MSDPLQQGRDHNITLEEAADMTRRHRNQATVSGLRKPEDGSLGGMFSKQAVLSLLAHPNAEYVRYYHARDAQGKRTIVLVASDSTGNDITDGGAGVLDRSWPCPPMCNTAASVLQG